YDTLRAADRLTRKIARHGDEQVILVAIDELAYFSATTGTKAQREVFTNLVRDLVARGRAAGIIMVAATHRPSADVVPHSLRARAGPRPPAPPPPGSSWSPPPNAPPLMSSRPRCATCSATGGRSDAPPTPP